MLQICEHQGCATLTLGSFCIEHEPPVGSERFPRGRPYPYVPRSVPLGAGFTSLAPDLEEPLPVRAVSLGGGT
jgi:hypothetical protein